MNGLGGWLTLEGWREWSRWLVNVGRLAWMV